MKQTGFSMVELMVVIAILGLLIAVAVPVYQDYVIRTQFAVAFTEVGAGRVGIDNHKALRAKPSLKPGDVGFIGIGTDPNASAQASKTSLCKLALVNENQPEVELSCVIGCGNGEGVVNEVLDKHQIRFKRRSSGSWECTTGVSSRYLPSGCTHDAAVSKGNC